ncbi:MAG: hypothetical protein WBX22_18400 [Silvibacterium sp.]
MLVLLVDLFEVEICQVHVTVRQYVHGENVFPFAETNLEKVRSQIPGVPLTPGRDGNPVLLQRLVPLPVKGASACRKLQDGTAHEHCGQEDEKQSVIFNLGAIRHVSTSEVEVEGGYLWGSQLAEGVYRVVRNANSSRVGSFEPTVMS